MRSNSIRRQVFRVTAATGCLFLLHCAGGDSGEDEANMEVVAGSDPSGNPTTEPVGSQPAPQATPSDSSPSQPPVPVPVSTPVSPMPMSSPVTPVNPVPTATASGSMSAPTPDATMPTPAGDGGSGGDAMMTAGAGGASGGAAGMGGAGGMSGGGGTGGASGGAAPVGGGEFTVTSMNFMDGDELPSDYTCEAPTGFGPGPIPQLSWANAPEGTLSFGVSFLDTKILDAMPTDSRGFHWAMWDIGADISEIPEGLIDMARLTELGGADQYSPLGDGFLGPCPNAEDVYAMTIYALDVETLPSPPNNVMQIVELLEEHSLGKAVITCTSDAMGGF